MTLNPLRAMVMIYSREKFQGQQSVGSEDRVETNGWTDGRTEGDECITSHANAVGSNVDTNADVCHSDFIVRWMTYTRINCQFIREKLRLR